MITGTPRRLKLSAISYALKELIVHVVMAARSTGASKSISVSCSSIRLMSQPAGVRAAR